MSLVVSDTTPISIHIQHLWMLKSLFTSKYLQVGACCLFSWQELNVYGLYYLFSFFHVNNNPMHIFIWVKYTYILKNAHVYILVSSCLEYIEGLPYPCCSTSFMSVYILWLVSSESSSQRITIKGAFRITWSLHWISWPKTKLKVHPQLAWDSCPRK